ncbi:MAG TPA: carboxymuconolactone decarboxylase family protein [Longimicrobiales bacterium]
MSLEEFRQFRERMNERILAFDNLEIRRFFALDDRTYRDGALAGRTKELLGLVASLVLRCDDCVTYHMVRCVEEGFNDAEILEALSVGLVVGGSIVIPHLRRAVATLDELRLRADDAPAATATPHEHPRLEPAP